ESHVASLAVSELPQPFPKRVGIRQAVFFRRGREPAHPVCLSRWRCLGAHRRREDPENQKAQHEKEKHRLLEAGNDLEAAGLRSFRTMPTRATVVPAPSLTP